VRKAPHISVVTVTLNDSVGLTYTVKSVEEQTYRNYEHIVVDGVSGDDTVEYCAATENRLDNFSYVSEKDRGIFDAMNKGARMARGDLLVFLNSSDVLTDQSVLSFVAERWSETDQWQWGYGAMRYTDSNRVPVRGTVQAPFDLRKFQLGRQFIPHAACYIGREFFLDHGAYDEAFGTAADQEFFMRICQTHPPAVWIRFLADFMLGGAHSKQSIWHVEALWHQMRVKNGVTIANSRHLDRMTSVAFAAAERSMLMMSKLVREDTNLAHVENRTKLSG
jgi:glycosyltransferase involved in cell wall biosynthesis